MGREQAALRVVVLLGGAVVDEKLLRAPGRVRLGRSARCELTVPSADAPERWLLFAARRGRWMILPPPGADNIV
jgi:hypothetical protein